jgi:hypothetical protein
VQNWEVGDGAVIMSANVSGHYIDHHKLQFAPVVVQSNVCVNVGATLQPLTQYHAGCTLRPYTTSIKGMSFKSGKVYAGNPSYELPAPAALPGI